MPLVVRTVDLEFETANFKFNSTTRPPHTSYTASYYYRIIASDDSHGSAQQAKTGSERQRKVRKIQEERGWESLEVKENVAAPALLQRSVVDSDSSEEADKSAFGKLVAGAVARVLGAKANFCRETSFERDTVPARSNTYKTPSTKAYAATIQKRKDNGRLPTPI